MHELSLAEGIVDIVERTAKANNVQRVKKSAHCRGGTGGR